MILTVGGTGLSALPVAGLAGHTAGLLGQAHAHAHAGTGDGTGCR